MAEIIRVPVFICRLIGVAMGSMASTYLIINYLLIYYHRMVSRYSVALLKLNLRYIRYLVFIGFVRLIIICVYNVQ